MISLAKAIALAADVHADQYDKGGKPYILHPIRVMQTVDVTDLPYSEVEVRAAAVLHDVLEDNKKYSRANLEFEIEKQFGEVVLRIVSRLTRDPDEDYLEHIETLIFQDSAACRIKEADLRDNMNILRQPTLRDKDLLRIQKYHMAYRRLREARRVQ